MKKKTASKPSVPWEVTESMVLTEEQAEGLLKFLRDAESLAPINEKSRAIVDRLIVEILLFSGLRNSELCHLTVADTEIGHGHPFLRVSESSEESRTVFIPRPLSKELVNFVHGPRRDFIPQGQKATDFSLPLILNERGRPYDRTALYRRVVRILTAAGLGDLASVQLLRHTYGYLAYQRSNGNLLFVQQQMGHAHPMVTAVYAQFVSFSYSDLADAVGGSHGSTSESDPKHTPRKSPARRTNR